jgi:hypothetical protein
MAMSLLSSNKHGRQTVRTHSQSSRSASPQASGRTAPPRARRRGRAGTETARIAPRSGNVINGTMARRPAMIPRPTGQGKANWAASRAGCRFSAPTSARRTPQNGPAASAASAPARARAALRQPAPSTAGARRTGREGSHARRRPAWRPEPRRRTPDMHDSHTFLASVPASGESLRTAPHVGCERGDLEHRRWPSAALERPWAEALAHFDEGSRLRRPGDPFRDYRVGRLAAACDAPEQAYPHCRVEA